MEKRFCELEFYWSYTRLENTIFMLGVAEADETTRVKAYRPYEASHCLTEQENEAILEKWWNENEAELKEVIYSPYDCTGKWFSAYQETEGTTLYDVQYLDV